MIDKKNILILHINTHDIAGGTAAVAKMLMQPGSRYRWNTEMLVGKKGSAEKNIMQIKMPEIDCGDSYAKYGYLYYDIFSTFKIENLPQFQQADVIHLHNLHGDYFNPFALVAISNLKPVVWTLHDMQSLTGHCAHSFDCDKFQTGCNNCPYLETEPAISVDTAAALWRDKKLIYANSNLNIVVPSKWLAGKVSPSILKEKPLEVICNGIDTEIFKPFEKQAARKKFNISANAVVLAFSANGGVNSQWRDGQCLADVMEYLSSRNLPVVFLNIGAANNDFNMPNTINVGHIKDKNTMAELYSAADMMLFPSLADNCPLVVMEAMACNCPVIAYKTGGIPEIVEHNKNGIIVDYKDRTAFIKTVEFLCGNRQVINALSSLARDRILNNFSKEIMLDKYNKLYEKVLQQPVNNKKAFVAVENNNTLIKAMESMFKSSPYLLNLYGQQLFHSRRFDEAIKVFQRVLEIDSKFQPAQNNLELVQMHSRSDYEYLVTAIVSTYNAEALIADCLSDLENQTIADKLEIVVIDSCSPQNEGEIIRKFQQKYNNIKYVRTEKRETIYKAWNRAIKLAKGKYITNANTDDRHTPEFLEKLTNALEQNPDKVVAYAKQEHYIQKNGQMVNMGKTLNKSFGRQELFANECHVGSQPVWRAALHTFVGYYDETFFITGDFEFWFRISQKFEFLFLDGILGVRFDRNEAVSNSSHETIILEELLIIQRCYSYAVKNNFIVDTSGISQNPNFADWPIVNIWKEMTQARLESRKPDFCNNVKRTMDYRKNYNPLLTIVIVRQHRDGRVAELLESLNRQTSNNFEVIVVDNFASLSQVEQATGMYKFDLCLVELEKIYGFSVAANIGIKLGRGQYFAFIDSLAIVSENFTESVLTKFSKYDIASLRGRIISERVNADTIVPRSYDIGDEIIPAACSDGVFCAFKKDILIQAGCFDGVQGEIYDLELSYRVFKKHHKKIESILYFPDITVRYDVLSLQQQIADFAMHANFSASWAKTKDRLINGYTDYLKTFWPNMKQEVWASNFMVTNIAKFWHRFNLPEALKWYKRAIELSPGLVENHYNLACWMLDAGQKSHAEQIFNDLLCQLKQFMVNANHKDIREIENYIELINKKLESSAAADKNNFSAISRTNIKNSKSVNNAETVLYPVISKSCDVSIVLCTMNRAELLDKMLASISAAAGGVSYEIIVVVGQCSDNTLEILKKHNITKIYNERECLGEGKHPWPQLYNFAFSKASGKWAMFASDDIIFGENCLANAVSVLNAQPENVAGGIFFYKNLHERPRPNPFDNNKFFIGMGYEFNILMNYGLLRLDYFNRVDGFDEVYNFYYADSDLCNKLYSDGKILLPLPASLIVHNDILDNLKKTNFEKLQQDINLYRGKWCAYYVDENNRPNRLVWQKELVADYIPKISNQTTLTAINAYWQGLSFFQRDMYPQAKERFLEAINEGLSDQRVYNYLNKCGGEENKNKEKNICGIIFSKDRAMQLDAAICSFRRCCSGRVKLYVLYKASNQLYKSQYKKLKTRFNDVIFTEQGDFKNDCLRLLNGSDYVLFAVDDNIFVSDFNIEKLAAILERQTDALGFSLRLGRNTTYCYSKDNAQKLPNFERIEAGVLKFDWTAAQLDFNYPLEVSSSIYRVSDILPLIEQLRFDTPNELEGLMALNVRLYVSAKKNLLCFEKSKTFCNPLNIVQSVCSNRASERKGYDAASLAGLFEQGVEIDINKYYGFVPNACHQEVELYFKNSCCSAKTPLVSVEMVAYNAEKYIAQAIESVLKQSFTDFELLVVDDGSDDKTEQIIKSFSDTRIKYIKQNHKGLAAGRNLAVNSATGKYIICVDSDDFIAADYLYRIVEYAKRNPGFDYYYPAKLTLVDDSGNLIGSDWDYNDFPDSRILPAVLFANGFSPIPIVGSLITKAIFDKIGLYEDCGIFEDFVYLCKNALKMKFNRFQANSTYFYRRLPDSASQKSEIRDKTISNMLNQMIAIYPPEVICPQLANISDPYEAKLQYYKYVSDIFYRHAAGFHFVKFGQYFRQFGDLYKEKFLAMQNRIQLQPQSTAGGI